MDYTYINEDKWNYWSKQDCVWTQPISHEEFEMAKEGSLPIYLTPLKAVPKSWIANLKGKTILGLASGGGQQCPYFVAQGAKVVVFDISDNQLSSEYLVSERENYNITIVKGDMTKPFPFEDNSFDIIFNPVSTSYIESLKCFWGECSRVLKPKGQLMTGFANPTIYLFNQLKDHLSIDYSMPFNPLTQLNKRQQTILFETDGIQFGHSFEEQFGGIIKSGFVIKDFYDDYHPTNNETTKYDTKIGDLAAKLSQYMPIYFSILAEKQ